MSNRDVPKMMKVTVCDYCDEEIGQSEQSEQQWAHILRGYISAPTKTATSLKFLWKKPRSPENYKDNTVVYDFHAWCFDKLMKEHIDNK